MKMSQQQKISSFFESSPNAGSKENADNGNNSYTINKMGVDLCEPADSNCLEVVLPSPEAKDILNKHRTDLKSTKRKLGNRSSIVNSSPKKLLGKRNVASGSVVSPNPKRMLKNTPKKYTQLKQKNILGYTSPKNASNSNNVPSSTVGRQLFAHSIVDVKSELVSTTEAVQSEHITKTDNFLKISPNNGDKLKQRNILGYTSPKSSVKICKQLSAVERQLFAGPSIKDDIGKQKNILGNTKKCTQLKQKSILGYTSPEKSQKKYIQLKQKSILSYTSPEKSPIILNEPSFNKDASHISSDEFDLSFEEWSPTIKEPSFNKDASHISSEEFDFSFEEWSPTIKEPAVAVQEKLKPLKMEHADIPLLKSVKRFMVHKIEKQNCQEIILDLCNVVNEKHEKCILSGFWADTFVKEKDIVHIEANSTERGYVIDNQEGFIIVNPDFLISGTSVVSMSYCPRKAVLMDKFRGVESGNSQMLHGTLIHQLFQKVIQCKGCTLNQIKLELAKILCDSRNLHDVYGLDLDEGELREHLQKVIPYIYSWCLRYFSRKTSSDVHVESILDIEENFWSPRYGLKGKVDITAKVNQKGSISVMPFELKTGRPTFSVEHKGQVTIYNMVMKDRYFDLEDGYLLYIKEGVDMKQISLDNQCKRGLIQWRNELAYNLSAELLQKTDEEKSVSYSFPVMPEPLNNARACTKCPQLLNCSLFQEEFEDRTFRASHVMNNLVPETLKHLSNSCKKFFRYWCVLIHLEMQLNRKQSMIQNIWLMSAQEREGRGECLSDMKLARNFIEEVGNNQFLHKFIRMESSEVTDSLSSVGLNAGDPCIISNQCNLNIAISSGIISDISTNHVTTILDRKLSKNEYSREEIYCIDKNNSFSTFTMNLSNLSYLMSVENEPLQQLIVSRIATTFKKTLPKEIVIKGKQIFKQLNKPQQQAILKTLMSEKYILMRGMPGTGKTLTIVSLIEILLQCGQTIFVSAYTHSALDNILIRLKQSGIDNFVRLGRISRIHNEIRPFAAEMLTKDFKTVKEISDFYESKTIVATTCLGTGHVVFLRRKFDICIIDEASQVLLPSCLGPLFHASKFVLVGDSKQLPPVVKSRVALKLGMSESLFSHLENDASAVDLNIQYRMNSEITRISNELTYEGKLICANDATKNLTLSLRLSSLSHESWIMRCLSDDMKMSVVFLNTNTIPLRHIEDAQGYIYNPGEANIVARLCTVIVKAGVIETDVGVVAPYRKQVQHIKDKLKAINFNLLDVNTVDQYQGQERRLIIISCVRTTHSNDSTVGILNDERRLNVAITRAKSKIIIIGDICTLKSFNPFKRLIDTLSDCQIINLPSELSSGIK